MLTFLYAHIKQVTELLYLCNAMKHRRHYWFVRCILICLTLACWNRADGFTTEDNHKFDSCLGIIEMPSTFVDTNGFCVSSLELTEQSCCFTSARTLVKAHRQSAVKHTKYGFAQVKWGHFASGRATSLCFSSVDTSPWGRDESKPLFLCLRKLIL